MPFPKLSAILNNCPLHALTPELKEEIIKLGGDSKRDHQYRKDYELLKRKFAEFYGIPPHSFTFEQFAEILNRYNAFDTQILLGPVLRQFMNVKMQQEKHDPTGFVAMLALTYSKSEEIIISEATEINENTGRYASLGPEQVFSYAAKFLGINIQYFSHGGQEACVLHNPLAEIKMYHEGSVEGAQGGGHWERTKNGEESIDVRRVEGSKLSSLLPLLSENHALRGVGFRLLSKHVLMTHKANQEQSDLSDEFNDIAISGAQLEKYIFNLTLVPKYLAKQLLGNDLTETTTRFIESYKPPFEAEEEPYGRLVKARLKNPFYEIGTEEVRKAIDLLLSKPPQAKKAPSDSHSHASISPQDMGSSSVDSSLLDNTDPLHSDALNEQLGQTKSKGGSKQTREEEMVLEEELSRKKVEELLREEQQLFQEKIALEEELSRKKIEDLLREEQRLSLEKAAREEELSRQAIEKILREERLAREKKTREQELSRQKAEKLQEEEGLSAQRDEKNTASPGFETVVEPIPSVAEPLGDSELTNTQLRQFNHQLQLLQVKAEIFADKAKSFTHNEAAFLRYDRAAKAAQALYTELYERFATFVRSNKTEADFKTFSDKSMTAIETHQDVLENHREDRGLFKQVLGNIILGILGIGVFYGIALYVNHQKNGRCFFFAPETAQQVSKIENMIPSIKVK
ncbi:hypothetical protein [Legionella cardiaca]|uniref:Effector protein B, substrate of the Dot/Icm secretion system n=1 Tax=Legionella cardiaca TaxID=1071983 RepID=A0ABY8AYI2_9GAMM|nr:hypothetical protein [Legionella cardiaca]WED44560.1 hypothetical protein PXX05_07170 [Legionella cardiaca]